MLIPGVEPDLIAYKTIVLTDTLYEQKRLILVSNFHIYPKIKKRPALNESFIIKELQKDTKFWTMRASITLPHRC